MKTIKITLYLLLVVFISLGFSYLVRNNNYIKIDWGNYEITTSSNFILASFFVAIVVSFLLGRVISLWKILGLKLKCSRITKGYSRGLELLTDGYLAFMTGNKQRAINYLKSSERYLGKQDISSILLNSAESFSNNKNVIIKSKSDLISMRYAIEKEMNNNEYELALPKVLLIKQYLGYKFGEDIDSVYNLFNIYKKTGMWESALSIIKRYKLKNINKRHEVAFLTFAIANDNINYINKALKFAALSYNTDYYFVPSVHLYLRLLLKSRRLFRALLVIKKSWRMTPDLFLFRIYLAIYNKLNGRRLFKKISSLASSNVSSPYSDYILSYAHMINGNLDQARRYINKAIADKRDKDFYKLLSDIEGLEYYGTNFAYDTLEKIVYSDDRHCYFCKNCGNKTLHFYTTCRMCKSVDSIISEVVKIQDS